MLLEILTPDQKVFEDEVLSVAVPGVQGSFEVLNNHAAIISTLEDGQIRIKQGGNKVTFFNIKGGVAEVLDNKVIILAEGASQA